MITTVVAIHMNINAMWYGSSQDLLPDTDIGAEPTDWFNMITSFPIRPLLPEACGLT